MTLNTNEQVRPGLHFNEQGIAEFSLWAPKATFVEISVIEKKIRLPLTETALGNWTIQTNQIKEGDLYQLILDRKTERPDPASLSQTNGVHGSSKAINLNDFNWTDTNWQNTDLEFYIIYELHTGTFSLEGTFAAIEDKLEHLKQLGINAIEIMPVAQFPGERNWGYDGVAPYAVQNSYGGAYRLQHLVDCCHEKGIAVILDVVYNHIGPEGNYFNDFGYYFTSKYNTPWGEALNFDDAYCDAVRNYFKQNALMWFKDFHIDALRLDAVHAIKDFSPVHILREIKIAVDQLNLETGKKHYLIAEVDLNDTRFINPLAKQGYGMDAQWIDEFHHALRITAGEPATGYFADFKGISDLAKSYTDAYVYDGQYSLHRKKHFGVQADENSGKQFVVFSQNHDQTGNRMLGERTSQLHSPEMQRLLAGAVLTAPYLPLLFMGEEWSETNSFQYFVSHTDEQLAEAVREGRKKEFADFHLQGEAPDPMSMETFEHSKLQWNLLEDPLHQNMFKYYQALIHLRKHHSALRSLNRKQIEVTVNEGNNTLLVHRWQEERHILCLMNFSSTDQEIQLPLLHKNWTTLIFSGDRQWNGHLKIPKNYTDQTMVVLPGQSLLILDQD
ncbi:malto-oligosyltrehalose trehalohydrolase [Arcticibacter eurypsychrophilus]|uniref:malto-oligosyltrehalose trehalohydrolase n=1 Tax=Arcticibacter eurypsychrophilus TaxID=1434752 RepID=UPI00084CF2BD|nr:malto-oligosyltrehalose trehalohydrolase [Arcticibacter eurypsychrophilus]